MPKETLNVGEIAQDVAEQVAEMVANSVATTKTNQLLTAAASAETARVNAETARESAEAERVAAEEARATEFAGFEDEIDSKITRGIGERDGTLSVGLADNLIATKGLTVNDDPMSFGIVGGASKSSVGDGNASLNKLVCVDVVRNQLADCNSATTSTPSNNVSSKLFTYYPSHKYWLAFDYSIESEIGNIYFLFGVWDSAMSSYRRMQITPTSLKGTIILRFNPDDGSLSSYSSAKVVLQMLGSAISSSNKVRTYNVRFIDLNMRYGPNTVVNAIIGTGTDEEKLANLLAFDPEILSYTDYDAGTLVPSKTAKLLPVGVNQWDEQTGFGQISTSDGSILNYGSTIYSKNNIRVFPSNTYYLRLPSNYPYGNGFTLFYYRRDGSYIRYNTYYQQSKQKFNTPADCHFLRFQLNPNYGSVYNNDVCVNVSDPNINGKYYPSKRNPVTLPNYEGHGILKVVDGKVVADGTELYPDGNSKDRYTRINLGDLDYSNWYQGYSSGNLSGLKAVDINYKPNALCTLYAVDTASNVASDSASYDKIISIIPYSGSRVRIVIKDTSVADADALKAKLNGVYAVFENSSDQPITTPVFQSTFPVEQGGTLQFLDEDDNPIAGLQGGEIFYQKNLKAFTEAMGEAVGWDPERIKRLGNLSFTPEYVDITLNPSPTGAYARAQVYNATFTIVISAALTGTAGGSITFQDSEVDLTNFQTKPAESIYDMDGKKVSEAPTTADCNIASFVGRSKSGIVLWSLLHSGVNKVKIHIEEAVPLDSSGNGKIDCRASLIL